MWQAAAKASEIAQGAGRSLEVAGQKIALFHVGGKFYALADTCPHRGGPLGDGHLEGTQVTCPWHAWQFDVTTGECQTMPGGKQPCFKTKIENGEVWIDI